MPWFKTFDSKRKTLKAQKDEKRKTSFRKEIVENADQHTPVLNKIMTNDLARIMRKIQSRSSFKYFHFK